jgi:hypothetical protein
MVNQRWAVVRDDDPTPLSMHDQRRAAVNAARTLADRDGVEIIVFDVGGRRLAPDSPDLTP